MWTKNWVRKFQLLILQRRMLRKQYGNRISDLFEEPKLSYKASSGEKDHKNQFEFNTNPRYKGKKQIKIRTYSHRSWSSSSNRCCPSFTFEIHWSKSISSLPSLCLGFSATNPNERRQLRNYRSSVWVWCQFRNYQADGRDLPSF